MSWFCLTKPPFPAASCLARFWVYQKPNSAKENGAPKRPASRPRGLWIPVKTLDRALISGITKCFISYREAPGKTFKSLGFGSRQRALDLVEEARKRARKKGSNG